MPTTVYTSEEYEAAEKKIETHIALSKKSFKDILINTLHLHLNNPEMKFSDMEALEMYETIQNIVYDTPKGIKTLAEFKQFQVEKFLTEQKYYDTSDT